MNMNKPDIRQARYGQAFYGGIYYRYGSLVSVETYANPASARAAAARPQVTVTIGKGTYLKPKPELVEW